MKDSKEEVGVKLANGNETQDNPQEHSKDSGPADSSRRSFMGKIGIGSAAAVALATMPLEPLIEGKHGEAEASVVLYRSNNRANDSFNGGSPISAAAGASVCRIPISVLSHVLRGIVSRTHSRLAVIRTSRTLL